MGLETRGCYLNITKYLVNVDIFETFIPIFLNISGPCEIYPTHNFTTKLNLTTNPFEDLGHCHFSHSGRKHDIVVSLEYQRGVPIDRPGIINTSCVT